MKRVLKILAIILFLSAPNVFANEVKVKNYKLQNNVEMNGIYSKHSFDFYIDEHWQVTGDSYVYLNVNISDMIKYKNSAITVYINGLPIGSINIYGEKNIQQAIPIQTEKLKTGFNNIKIIAFKMIDGDDKFENINIGNYIELLSDCYVHIEYFEENIEPSLKSFPYPFLKLGNDNKFETVILVGYDKEEYLSMLYLSSALGKYDSYSNLNLNVKNIKDFNVDDVDKNIIILSSYWKLDDKVRKEIKDDEKSKIGDKALVKVTKSPYNKNRLLLLITSFDNKKIVEAAKTLGDFDFIREIEGDKFFIGEYKGPKEEERKELFTLKDLGFKDIVLNRFLNDFDFIIDIPKEENLKDSAYIEFKYRYSTLLDFNKSTIGVYINGLPYQDKRLSEKNSNLDSMKIKLKDFKNYTRLNIGVKFNLVPKTKDKEPNIDEDLFAVLLNSSNIYVPTEYEKRRDFRYYPAPLVEKGRFNNLNLVIPNKLDNTDLTSLSNIFAYLGHSIKTLDGLSVDYDFDKSKNNLVYGIDIKDEIKQKMTVYIEDGKFKLKEGVNITLGEDDAVVQVADGFLDNTFIITFLAKDKEGLKNIQRYLSDFDFVERLKGNVCVINSRGAVKCYELNKIELVDNNKRLFLYLSIASSIIVLILLIFVAIKYKK